MADLVNIDDVDSKTQKDRHAVLKNSLTFDENRYTYDDKFVPWNRKNDGDHVHTMVELAELLKTDPKIQIEGTVLGHSTKERSISRARVDRAGFLEAFAKADKISNTRLREAFNDPFATDRVSSAGLVGDDFVPFLGGPFYKQLYIYDYLRMHGYSFWAVNHWPMARAAINIIRDFTLGRGYRIDFQTMDGKKHDKASAIWDAFEQANDLRSMMEYLAVELATYGETLLWWLPNNETKITYQLGPGQTVPKGYIPRVKLLDPSMIWEIVTYPEDISRVLYYQWVSPTQYQIYTNGSVPSTKFIVQQLPGDQVDHYKINCMSNEKRGRSDLFAALGFMKRLTDSVNYSIIGLQKASAWSIDTAIDGNKADINNYIASQQALSTIPNAGSEFVHSTKVTRQYLGNQASSRGGQSQVFDWCTSMAAMALGIPVSYFGTHLSGGQTRASAMIATEPVAKRFEMRQAVYEKIILKMAQRLFAHFGISDVNIEVTMPELMVQDRSAKLKDLALAESQKWLSKERAAEIASKEFQITNYDYDVEKVAIDTQGDEASVSEENPLSSGNGMDDEEDDESDEVTNEDRKALGDSRGF